MKNTFLILLFFALIPSAGANLFPKGYLPAGTYTADEKIAGIKSKAAAKGQPIVYIRFKPDSQCGVTQHYASLVAKEFGAKAVVVYAPYERREHVPKAVRARFTKEHCGSIAPWIVIADSKTDAVIHNFGAEGLKQNARAVLQEAHKKVAAGK